MITEVDAHETRGQIAVVRSDPPVTTDTHRKAFPVYVNQAGKNSCIIVGLEFTVP